jgi:hypothetical protein
MRRCGFCNAKRKACVLCAAQLIIGGEAGDCIAGFVALLGRFLPRLGPFGSPSGPFSFHTVKQAFSKLFGARPDEPVATVSQHRKSRSDRTRVLGARGLPEEGPQEPPATIAMQYNFYSAAARRSSRTGSASNTCAAISDRTPINFGKPLLLERVASSR